VGDVGVGGERGCGGFCIVECGERRGWRQNENTTAGSVGASAVPQQQRAGSQSPNPEQQPGQRRPTLDRGFDERAGHARIRPRPPPPATSNNRGGRFAECRRPKQDHRELRNT